MIFLNSGPWPGAGVGAQADVLVLAHDMALHLAAFDPDEGGEGKLLMNTLAWCASAAGVAGLISLGIMMALQLRHGEPGANAQHIRGFSIIMVACVLATTAGPLVTFLGPLTVL
jgi:hypothetical protein